MKALQTQYNLIKEGKGHKDVFVKEAKRLFPNIIPNSAGFDQTQLGLIKLLLYLKIRIS